MQLDADIVCVGFGPASAGFLNKIADASMDPEGNVLLESPSIPGMPLQVLCYERADDVGFGVSGVVTSAKAIKEDLPDLKPEEIPMATAVATEKLIYLLDPIGASIRPLPMRVADKALRIFGPLLGVKDHAFSLPWIPGFINKHDGLILSMGQFTQWVSTKLMATGSVQIWPGSHVSEAIIENNSDVTGVRLADQGVDKNGNPADGFTLGMEVNAPLTVVADGPLGAIGQQLDKVIGTPEDYHNQDWALGMKFVVDLPEDCELKEGTVIHTIGFPEPEIFGFLYVHPDNIASLGIFVPSTLDSPVRTAYRYLQHWMMHPSIWKHLKDGKLRSWGAKTLRESGKRGEPFLVGNGFARIGEGSGATNVLTNSGVDEAWATGSLLGDAVIKLLKEKLPFTKENLENTYVKLRRESWVEKEGIIAKKARDGFQRGIIQGLLGTFLTGITKGKINIPGKPGTAHARVPDLKKHFANRIPEAELSSIREQANATGDSVSNPIMDRLGWPQIPLDGKLLVSQQDALLLGGKVQAAPGFADHVKFLHPEKCEVCDSKICVEMCSGQAITPSDSGQLLFDREKCIHCGACLWNCTTADPDNPEATIISFLAGSGGLHSNEN